MLSSHQNRVTRKFEPFEEKCVIRILEKNYRYIFVVKFCLMMTWINIVQCGGNEIKDVTAFGRH